MPNIVHRPRPASFLDNEFRKFERNSPWDCSLDLSLAETVQQKNCVLCPNQAKREEKTEDQVSNKFYNMLSYNATKLPNDDVNVQEHECVDVEVTDSLSADYEADARGFSVEDWIERAGDGKGSSIFGNLFKGRRHGSAGSTRQVSKKQGSKEGKESKKQGKKKDGDKVGKDNNDDDKNKGKKGDDKDDDKKEKKDDEKEEESEEESSEEEDVGEDVKNKVEEEPEGYDILKDPDFKDLETESEFPEDEENAHESVLDQARTELYDVLDKNQKTETRDLAIERKLAKRGIVPKCPKGGWKWRPAKFLSEETPENEEGVIWKLEFIDDEGGETTINVKDEEACIAPYKSQLEKKVFHKLQKNDKVDVLDYFWSKRHKQRLKKWRQGTVLAVEPYWVRVTYEGWGPVWDEWFHVYEHADRLAEFSKMTKRIQRRIKRRKDNFQKVLNRKRNLQLVEMAADGNCLFRTVAHQVYGTPEKHKKVREECVTYMGQNVSRFNMFVANIRLHLRKMAQDGEWGDEIEIRAMEEIYDRPFEIYFVAGLGINYKPTKTQFDGDLPKRAKKITPIRLSFHGNCHYNSIVPADLKMKKDKSFAAPARRTTSVIKNHREKMLRKAIKEEERVKKEAREKERLEKEKKEKEKADADAETQQNEEKSEEGDDNSDEGASKKGKIKKNADGSSEMIVIAEGRKSDSEASDKSSSNDESQESPADQVSKADDTSTEAKVAKATSVSKPAKEKETAKSNGKSKAKEEPKDVLTVSL